MAKVIYATVKLVDHSHIDTDEWDPEKEEWRYPRYTCVARTDDDQKVLLSKEGGCYLAYNSKGKIFFDSRTRTAHNDNVTHYAQPLRFGDRIVLVALNPDDEVLIASRWTHYSNLKLARKERNRSVTLYRVVKRYHSLVKGWYPSELYNEVMPKSICTLSTLSKTYPVDEGQVGTAEDELWRPVEIDPEVPLNVSIFANIPISEDFKLKEVLDDSFRDTLPELVGAIRFFYTLEIEKKVPGGKWERLQKQSDPRHKRPVKRGRRATSTPLEDELFSRYPQLETTSSFGDVIEIGVDSCRVVETDRSVKDQRRRRRRIRSQEVLEEDLLEAWQEADKALPVVASNSAPSSSRPASHRRRMKEYEARLAEESTDDSVIDVELAPGKATK